MNKPLKIFRIKKIMTGSLLQEVRGLQWRKTCGMCCIAGDKMKELVAFQYAKVLARN